MRIVIDLQGDQSNGSRNRGIGRYSLSIAQAIARNRGHHEVFIALSSAFPDSIDPIKSSFVGLLPPDNIRVWDSMTSVNYGNKQNRNRRMAAEKIREAFLANLQPDVIYITSLLEGLGDDTVTSVGAINHGIPTVITLYDLIPYIYRDPYLVNPDVSEWYFEKIDFLKKSSMLLAISDSARNDAIKHLGLCSSCVVNIAAAAEPHFKPLSIPEDVRRRVLAKYELVRPYVMYTGGTDYRKNIEGLIRAYAMLPEALRRAHQLAVICSVNPTARQTLEKLALDHGLTNDELILTGFVPDEDLVWLYNLSKAFVFPSKYEGFGLPALEAMSCGIPTIASNCSSLPEVIGREDALFDPNSDFDISSKLHEVLADEAFQADLATSGIERAKLFSWDSSAKFAIMAFEKTHAEHTKAIKLNASPRLPKLAYVSPLPPDRSGIADYSAELIVALLRHYEITLVSPQKIVDTSWMPEELPVHTPEWLIEQRNQFDRVLYHFGNSEFHSHMFAMVEEVSGVVVLHDFFLSGILNHLEHQGFKEIWSKHIFESHGYPALVEKLKQQNSSETVWKYPGNARVICQAKGVIVHSRNSEKMAVSWYGKSISTDWVTIPLLKTPATPSEKWRARAALGIEESKFLVCSFGLLGPTKLNHRLIHAWNSSKLARDKPAMLVFVGQNEGGEYGMQILNLIEQGGFSETIRITGWTSNVEFRDYLAAADLGVQLRTNSRGETSAAILDCMGYGLPVITNANGSMAEIDPDATWMLPDEFTDDQLIVALESLHCDATKRDLMGQNAQAMIRNKHAPQKCAQSYWEAIERFYKRNSCQSQDLIHEIANIKDSSYTDSDILEISSSIAFNLPLRVGLKNLFVDVSELCRRDAKSGIQRVVKRILEELFKDPPQGYRIEPIYCKDEKIGYFYARNFTMNFLGCECSIFAGDNPIDFEAGDVFLGLDLHQNIHAQQKVFQKMRNHGVEVNFVLYDLIPLTHPHCFPDEFDRTFEKWVVFIVNNSDKVIAISDSTSIALKCWLSRDKDNRAYPLINYFHLGSDFTEKLTSASDHIDKVIPKISSRPAFLCVSTIEPRKNHEQILDAFELLWTEGLDLNLVLVGKQGWRVDALITRLRNHPELDQRLFWLEGVSDEFLSQIYQASAALVFASVAEGFGLALIEAAHYGLPLIVRDIPVFREVAGEHAHYFEGMDPVDLATAVKKWIQLDQGGKSITSDGMPFLSWKQSSRELIRAMGL